MKKEITTEDYNYIPIAGSSFINWIKVLVSNGVSIDKQYLTKALYLSIKTLTNSPLIIQDNLKFSQKIEDTQIKIPPIFILGHWRSGTTYLFHLLSRDPNLGYMTCVQVLGNTSEIFLGSPDLVKCIADKNFPLEREIDSITLAADDPEEEEWPLLNASPYSCDAGWLFPRNYKMIFKQFALFDEDEIDESVKNKWKKAYIKLLKKLTFIVDGKQLIVKNPTNTARAKVLLEIFPEAKFIHIYRNPYKVYASTKKLHESWLPYSTLQSVNEAEIEDNILFLYKEMMNKFFTDKKSIPPQNLVEIKYENFVGNEVEELKRIYSQFNLPGFEQTKTDFEKYIEEEKKKYIEYNNNNKNQKYTWDKTTIEKIEREWKFAIEEWQYDVPD